MTAKLLEGTEREAVEGEGFHKLRESDPFMKLWHDLLDTALLVKIPNTFTDMGFEKFIFSRKFDITIDVLPYV